MNKRVIKDFFSNLDWTFWPITILVIGTILTSCYTMFAIIQFNQTYAQEYPKTPGYVVDDANVISEDVERRLNEKLKVAQQQGVTEMSIVTVKTTAPLTIEQYSIELARSWGIGNKETDNGLLLLLAVEDRDVRIEVGRGLEGNINDAKAGRILDKNAVPHFKNNEWGQGLEKTADALISEIDHPTSYPDNEQAEEIGSATVIFILLCGILIFAVFIIAIASEGASSGFGGTGSNLLGAALLASAIGGDDSDDSDNSSSSGSSGFGGFGGGSFGGGGAGRSF